MTFFETICYILQLNLFPPCIEIQEDFIII
jgi:hypothetical protein